MIFVSIKKTVLIVLINKAIMSNLYRHSMVAVYDVGKSFIRNPNVVSPATHLRHSDGMPWTRITILIGESITSWNRHHNLADSHKQWISIRLIYDTFQSISWIRVIASCFLYCLTLSDLWCFSSCLSHLYMMCPWEYSAWLTLCSAHLPIYGKFTLGYGNITN